MELGSVLLCGWRQGRGRSGDRRGGDSQKGGREPRCPGLCEGEKGPQGLVGLGLAQGLKGSYLPLTSASLALRLPTSPPHPPNTWVLTTACSLSGSRAVTDTGLRLDSRACT